MLSRNQIGIIAPSSVVPPVEFELGVEALKEAGFALSVHPQCRKNHLFFAGTDEQRGQAFYDYATDPEKKVLWCARGGYGAARILPLLEKLTHAHGVPEEKLLVGYSDATALLEFVRSRWGWSALHAPMPGIRAFCRLTEVERETLFQWIKREKAPMPWGRKKLKFVGPRPRGEIQGPLVGGNLTVWASLLGTPYQFAAGQEAKPIFFFEDIGEGLYRLDRMVQQLLQSGALQGAQAIVLGNFEACQDVPPSVLARRPSPRQLQRVLSKPKPRELGPLRKKFDADRWIPKLFGQIGEALGIPVAYGLPVGHGPGHASLPLGRYRLTSEGYFELIQWDWIR